MGLRLCPQRGPEVWGRSPPEVKSVLMRKYDFCMYWKHSLLEGIVEIQHLYCTCVTMIGIV